MPSRRYEFLQLDVFTQTPLTGNPLAIFTDARGLSTSEIQALAREMNLSETTFILPRDAVTEAREGRRVRIFTVEEELPFAGHPTLGTAMYLHTVERTPASNAPDEITLDLNVGKVPVRFNRDSGSGQIFGEMRQRDPEFGAVFSREEVAGAIGIGVDEIVSEGPIQAVSTGLAFAIVPLRNQKTLETLNFSHAKTFELLNRAGARFFYFLCPARGEGRLEVRARMFFYGGEDPATGSAAGCAASWMVRHGLAKTDEQVLIRQGVEIHRPSEIYVRATQQGERVTDVRVGGYAVEVLRGSVTLP
jgi:trans-2,3-dihydro-3-hydroxyanthranilate isomerase